MDASTSNGATVPGAFTASATDNVTASPVIKYSVNGTGGTQITSNYIFPLGNTLVIVTATDDAGNVAAGTFTVTVNPPLAITTPNLPAGRSINRITRP